MANQSHFPVVGIVGGSQIARMLLEAATRLNIEIKLLCNNAQDSAALIANNVSVGDTSDLSELIKFALNTEVITFDTYQVSLDNLKKLEEQGQLFRPSLSNIATLQDLDLVRDELASVGLVLKTSDVQFERELSVQVARSPHGQSVVYPVSQIRRVDDVLDEVITPAPDLSEDNASQLQSIALRISELFKITGIFSVEFIDTGNSNFLISQIKLGPTNAGHWTIDGSTTSQFENHLRAILDLPLGSPNLVAPFTVMVNVLGGQYLDMYKPFLHCMAHDPELRIHLYGKEVTEGRKVGHVNISGQDVEDLLERAHHAADYLTGRITE
jgi:5-(carboxyamino)imidazole ribonucleotide synthase